MSGKGWLAGFIGFTLLAILPFPDASQAAQARTSGPGKQKVSRIVKSLKSAPLARQPAARITSPRSIKVAGRSAARPAAPTSARQAALRVRSVGTTRKMAGASRDKVIRGGIIPVSRKAALGAVPAALALSGSAAAASGMMPTPLGDAVNGTLSIGEAIGLHRVPDPLALRSGVALVVDPATGEILFEKNSRAVLPIASITKLMTAMVVLDARQSLTEPISINEADRDTERFSKSWLPIGSTLSRAELLQLALMSSENRAASALARHYPGGLDAYVRAANRKAAEIGMRDSVFMDGTGLSSGNVATARDLAVMVNEAARYPLIREFSTAEERSVRTSHGPRVFRTTNRMVASHDWDLALQKTGYISEAGNCLVIQGMVDGRRLIMVLLDSQGRYSRLGDAQRLRKWLEG